MRMTPIMVVVAVAASVVRASRTSPSPPWPPVATVTVASGSPSCSRMAVAAVVVAVVGFSAYFRTNSVYYRPIGTERRVPVIHRNPESLPVVLVPLRLLLLPAPSGVPSVVAVTVAVVVVRTKSKGSPSTGCRGASKHRAAGRTYRTGSGSRRTGSSTRVPSKDKVCYGRWRGFCKHPSSDCVPGRCGTRGRVVVVDFGP
uniref:Putative secreted peptide n=1 Tax=Anopheles braziliensis TaxID=58242 RepID=A0A2M3ZNW1_9DIPT